MFGFVSCEKQQRTKLLLYRGKAVKIFYLAIVSLLSKKACNENSNAGSDFPIDFIRMGSSETVKNPLYNSFQVLRETEVLLV